MSSPYDEAIIPLGVSVGRGWTATVAQLRRSSTIPLALVTFMNQGQCEMARLDLQKVMFLDQAPVSLEKDVIATLCGMIEVWLGNLRS